MYVSVSFCMFVPHPFIWAYPVIRDLRVDSFNEFWGDILIMQKKFEDSSLSRLTLKLYHKLNMHH